MGRGGGFIAESIDRIAPAVIVLAAAVVIIGALRLFLAPDDPRRSRWSRSVALGAAVAFILVATLTTREAVGEEAGLKLVPFLDLVRALEVGARLRGAIAELAANVLLFVPFGVTLRLRFEDLSIAQVAAITFALSFVIETLQLLLAAGRVANITDVLTNTLGGVVGAMLVRQLVPARRDG